MRGSGFARGVVAFFTALSLIGGIVELFSIGGHLIAQGLTSIVVALVVLYILFGERDGVEFFEREGRG